MFADLASISPTSLRQSFPQGFRESFGTALCNAARFDQVPFLLQRSLPSGERDRGKLMVRPLFCQCFHCALEAGGLLSANATLLA
jgi:hypothetical protein